MSRRPNWHPLLTFFLWRGFTVQAGLNWLQLRAWISDNVVQLHDVASPDVERILAAAKVRHFFPSDLAPLCRRPDPITQ